MQEDFLQYATPNSSLTDLLASNIPPQLFSDETPSNNLYKWDDKGNWGPAQPPPPVVLDEYAKVYAEIPDEYKTSAVNPQGATIATHAATYNPYHKAQPVVERDNPTLDSPAGGRWRYTPTLPGQGNMNITDPRNPGATYSYKRELANPSEGDQILEGKSVYVWIGDDVSGGFVYQGENDDPNLLDKRQFMANYKQKEAEIDTVVQSLSESPGTLPQATPISLPGWTIPGMSNLFTQPPNIGNNNQSGLAGSLNRLTSNPLPFNQWFS